MRIQIRNQITDQSQWLTLPCSEQTIQQLCDTLLYTENTAFTEAMVTDIQDEAAVKSLLTNQVVRLDEINFLAKSLERLGQYEVDTFYTVAVALGYSQMRERINLSFNTQCYTRVHDFSNLQELSKKLIPLKYFNRF